MASIFCIVLYLGCVGSTSFGLISIFLLAWELSFVASFDVLILMSGFLSTCFFASVLLEFGKSFLFVFCFSCCFAEISLLVIVFCRLLSLCQILKNLLHLFCLLVDLLLALLTWFLSNRIYFIRSSVYPYFMPEICGIELL